MSKNARMLPFQQSWYFTLNDSARRSSLWLTFSVLRTTNRFRQIAEVTAIHFQQQNDLAETNKVAVRQTFDIEALSTSEKEGIQMGECSLGEGFTKGSIQSKGRTLAWNLTFSPRTQMEYPLISPIYGKLGILKNTAVTTHADLLCEGTIQIGSESYTVHAAPAMRGVQSGPRHPHSWIWGHCNDFKTPSGAAAPFLFEGMSGRAWVMGGWLLAPKVSTLHFVYEGRAYRFDSHKDALRIRSHINATEWRFRAERDDVSFRGVAKAPYKAFAGMTLEDTDGSLLYLSTSGVADSEIHVYRREKLEATFHSNSTTTLEVASRNKSPYIPILV